MGWGVFIFTLLAFFFTLFTYFYLGAPLYCLKFKKKVEIRHYIFAAFIFYYYYDSSCITF